MRREPFAALFIAMALWSCSEAQDSKEPSKNPATASTKPPGYQAALPEELRAVVNRRFTGDLDGMVERRLIRIAAPFNRTFYFLDGGVERGLSYDYAKLFEKSLNEQLGSGHPGVHIVILPMPRDALLPALNDGLADMAVAQLTITPERLRIADFTIPTRANVTEIWVSGPGSTPARSSDAFGGRQVFVRKSSSYFQSLQLLNNRLTAAGKPSVDIREAPENLEDDDLLEMVSAGLIPATVTDDYLAQFWKRIFPGLVLSEAAPLRTGGQLAVAVRKSSPQLKGELDSFIQANGLDTTLGAILNKRYLKDADYVRSAAAGEERRKFLAVVDLFRKYGRQYDFDYLLMAAQGYQESRLDQGAKSHVGAIGVMQLMPATGEEQKVGRPTRPRSRSSSSRNAATSARSSPTSTAASNICGSFATAISVTSRSPRSTRACSPLPLTTPGRAASSNFARKPQHAVSIPTFGSAMSSRWQRIASVRNPSLTSAISTNITSPTG